MVGEPELQPPHQHDRAKTTPVAGKAWRRVDHAQLVAGFVGQFGAKDGRVAQVILLRGGQSEQLDVEETAGGVGAVDQRGEDRVGVEPGKAAPDDAGAIVDECADAAIADQAQLQGRIGLARLLLVRHGHSCVSSRIVMLRRYHAAACRSPWAHRAAAGVESTPSHWPPRSAANGSIWAQDSRSRAARQPGDCICPGGGPTLTARSSERRSAWVIAEAPPRWTWGNP